MKWVLIMIIASLPLSLFVEEVFAYLDTFNPLAATLIALFLFGIYVIFLCMSVREIWRDLKNLN